MIIKEMAPWCREQARVLRRVIQALQQEKRTAQSEEARADLAGRIQALYPIVREMEELADHMEHYYDRGYDRNEKYTI